MLGGEQSSWRLLNYASVTFPAGAFLLDSRLVELSATNFSETAQNFSEATTLFRVNTKLEYEIRVNTGNLKPANDF